MGKGRAVWSVPMYTVYLYLDLLQLIKTNRDVLNRACTYIQQDKGHIKHLFSSVMVTFYIKNHFITSRFFLLG